MNHAPFLPSRYAQTHSQRFVTELKDFVRFPTVSAQPKHANDLKECAAWLANHLREISMERVKIVPTGGHPALYAEWLKAPGRPTVLIYGHYDVQPAEPLNEWRSPPFQPTVDGNYLYGRGTSDDKGQLFCHINALEAYLKTGGALPVNVKCLIEGEEEIGSPNLGLVIAQNASRLTSDVAVISDSIMLRPDRPAITYGLRGGLGLEIEVYGPSRDLHSGQYGGAVHNPLQALCEIVSKLHDANGRVTIPGFYDHVRPVNVAERAALVRSGKSDEQMLRETGASTDWGEQEYSPFERTTIRPALTVNGIVGGYTGPGGKGVIPAKAVAKISVRLVPDQDPNEIERLFHQHIAHLSPPTVRSKIRTLLRAKPALLPLNHSGIQAAATAYQKVFGVLPVFTRSGGTIPPVSMFQEVLGIPTVLMGFGLPGDNIHAPNERFYLPNFYRGIATSIHFLAQVCAKHSLGIEHSSKQTECMTLTQ